MAQGNYIERVAIVGAGGHIGKHFTEQLLKTGKHIVTAITRIGSTSSLPEGAKRVEVNYDDLQALAAALRGQEFLIITLSLTAPPESHTKIAKAASEAGVPYIMPNCYGSDIQNETLRKEDLYSDGALKRCLEVGQYGNAAYIGMVCGFWYEWSLALGANGFGFDIKNKSVTFIDDGNTKITVSTSLQCGRAVAALLSLPESGAEPAVSHWKNKPFYIGSFTISQRDMLDSIHRVTGSTDADWTISYEPSKQRYQDGLAEMAKGERMGFVKALYTRIFFQDGGGNFEANRGLANDTIGLRKEDIDEATKRAIELISARV
ncbi:isoflavone reductase family protein [Aspergillus sclerotialis]|uniref:Isoflavone reductase family protein n=1 Tax=Aspergillus sclerotialis TaxID=2070753 RepID=A0A3A2ZVJ1_9EURO|nr:isoflavone reductase family protein [Aspergillus sclerotialis]